MDGLKQRIVGALVLISLAVIFVPMLFDEPHTERTSSTIDLPEEPAFPAVDANESGKASQPASQDTPAYTLQEQPEDNAASASDTPMSDNANASSSEPMTSTAPQSSGEPARQGAPEPAPKPDAKPQPVVQEKPEAKPEPDNSAEYAKALEGAWLVQLGSFGDEKNALRLRDEVRDKGYSAYTQSVERGDLTLTRVFSGPFVSKDDARSAKQKLDKSFALNSLVMAGDK